MNFGILGKNAGACWISAEVGSGKAAGSTCWDSHDEYRQEGSDRRELEKDWRI